MCPDGKHVPSQGVSSGRGLGVFSHSWSLKIWFAGSSWSGPDQVLGGVDTTSRPVHIVAVWHWAITISSNANCICITKWSNCNEIWYHIYAKLHVFLVHTFCAVPIEFPAITADLSRVFRKGNFDLITSHKHPRDSAKVWKLTWHKLSWYHAHHNILLSCALNISVSLVQLYLLGQSNNQKECPYRAHSALGKWLHTNRIPVAAR